MRRTTIAAIVLAGLALLMDAAGIILLVATVGGGYQIEGVLYTVTGLVLGLAYPILGWLIATRRRDNRIAWIFILVGFSQALDTLSAQYANWGLVIRPGALPFAAEASWLANWTWAPGFVLLLTLSILLFPDGRMPSTRWAPVAWAAVLALGLIMIPTAVASWPYRGLLLVVGTRPAVPAIELANMAQLIGLLLTAGAAFASVVSLLVRFRRSHGVERQQLKWLTFAAAIEITAVTPSWLLPPLPELVGAVLAIIVAPLIPIALGIAILRYRLYDIDRIISRTLAYAVLTAVLAAVYLAGFLGIQAILARFTGNGGPVAVAASTLAVFALFTPVRRRIQTAVERRFYRRRYDAAREIEGFAARVRDEVEVDRLTVALASTLERTMQPASASIWLRSGGSR